MHCHVHPFYLPIARAAPSPHDACERDGAPSLRAFPSIWCGPAAPWTLSPDLREIEYPVISAALAATRGNQIKAAELLGLNRKTLRKKVRDLDIRWMRNPIPSIFVSVLSRRF